MNDSAIGQPEGDSRRRVASSEPEHWALAASRLSRASNCSASMPFGVPGALWWVRSDVDREAQICVQATRNALEHVILACPRGLAFPACEPDSTIIQKLGFPGLGD